MSARDAVERLECRDVFGPEGITRDYADRIVDIAFATDGAASPTAGSRLLKWTSKPRILVRSDTQPLALPADAIWQVHADLQAVIQQDVPIKFDLPADEPIRDGDLVVYLSWAFGSDKAAAERRRERVLHDFYGADMPDSRPLYGNSRDRLYFVDVVQGDDGSVRRALVAIDQPYADQAWVIEMITTALNPNPGNAINLGLPGSTPQEKRIYEIHWQTQVDYRLYWTREFQAYLRLLFDSRVPAASDANEFRDAVGGIMKEAAFQAWLRNLYDCAS
jgi:hypothetical protein